MRRLDQKAQINILLIPFILVLLLLVGAVGFGVWSYQSRQQYKNHTDQIVAQQVEIAKQAESTAKDKEFIQKQKQPLTSYTSPDATGSVSIQYPKTWSAYVDDTVGSSSADLNGYFYPKVVPNISDTSNSFALRVQLQTQSYSSVLQQFQGQVQQGQARVTPFQPKNVPHVIGARVDGQITPSKQGSMVVLPLRNQTLEIWTEDSQFVPDFNNIILPNLSFSP